MDTLATAAALPPNTLGTNAFLFMAIAWTCVLSLMLWSFSKLLRTPENEKVPPAGSIS
jgi:hypothetical protein